METRNGIKNKLRKMAQLDSFHDEKNNTNKKVSFTNANNIQYFMEDDNELNNSKAKEKKEKFSNVLNQLVEQKEKRKESNIRLKEGTVETPRLLEITKYWKHLIPHIDDNKEFDELIEYTIE